MAYLWQGEYKTQFSIVPSHELIIFRQLHIVQLSLNETTLFAILYLVVNTPVLPMSRSINAFYKLDLIEFYIPTKLSGIRRE